MSWEAELLLRDGQGLEVPGSLQLNPFLASSWYTSVRTRRANWPLTVSIGEELSDGRHGEKSGSLAQRDRQPPRHAGQYARTPLRSGCRPASRHGLSLPWWKGYGRYRATSCFGQEVHGGGKESRSCPVTDIRPAGPGGQSAGTRPCPSKSDR